MDIRKHLPSVDSIWQDSIEQILIEFERKVLQQKHRFAHSIIHGDINEQNLVIQQANDENDCLQGDCRKSDWKTRYALIDFGDVHYAPTIFDLALFCTYALIICSDDLSVIKHILNGVNSVGQLSSPELEIIPVGLIFISLSIFIH